MRSAYPTYLALLLGLLLNFHGLPPCAAQQPAHFVLGGNQFNGMQVYDVIQDGQLNYIISTNEGLFYYDYLRFEQIGCGESKSSSLFNFVADKEGTVYCNNLNHQIFRIKDKECALFHELSLDDDCADLSLAVSKEGNLIASGKKLLLFSKNGEVLQRKAGNTTHWGQPYLTREGKVLYHYMGTDSLVVFEGGKFSTLSYGEGSGMVSRDANLRFFEIQAQLYAIDLKAKTVFSFDQLGQKIEQLPDVAVFQRSPSMRIYPVGGKAWMAGTLPGVVFVKDEFGKSPPELFYEDYFISDVFQDHEGNLLLSTFNKGILVIPDPSIPDVISPFREDPINSLYWDEGTKRLYMGSSKGSLLQYDHNGIKEIASKGVRPIEGVYGGPNFPYILFDNGIISGMGLDGNLIDLGVGASLKDVVIVDSNTAFLGTGTGLVKCSWGKHGKIAVERMPEFNFRIHSMAYEPKGKQIICSTSNGLHASTIEGAGTKITANGKDIFPTALCTEQGKVYAMTPNDGILIFEASALRGQIWPETPNSERLSKIIVHGGRLFGKSSHGLYQFGMNGKLQRNLGKEFGFTPTHLQDFEVTGNVVWASHSGGVQAIDLSHAEQAQSAPPLRIVRVLASAKPMDPNAMGHFSSEERKVQFELSSPSLRHRQNLRIHYLLEGYDTDWLSKPYDGIAIVYNALAPGSYTFRAKTENHGKFCPEVSYSFRIASPVYARWWFIASIALLLIGLAALATRRQFRIQRRKAAQINELNASKLTAIQSQMNPHFIFNALNSIQDLVLKGDVENSYSYITTFSNLVRSALQFSEKDFIDFDQELKLLNLYLSLEKLRFKNDLSYHIEAEDIEDIQLPPLLIQPFVENALLHGLLHKEGPKRLSIRFELHEALVCTIEDNGIGRERARAIRERQRADHESFSGKAIRKRFDILSDVFKGKFGYEFEDLYEEGRPVGTRITLQIPVKRRF